jgi:hypothetical protein
MANACVGLRLEHLNALKPTHLSLHYDGVRVTLPPDTDIDALCKSSSDHIFASTL